MIRPRITQTTVKKTPLPLDLSLESEFPNLGKEYLSLSRRGKTGVIVSYYDQGYRQLSVEVQDFGQDQEVIDDELFNEIIKRMI